jgi:hypothetical protein
VCWGGRVSTRCNSVCGAWSTWRAFFHTKTNTGQSSTSMSLNIRSSTRGVDRISQHDRARVSITHRHMPFLDRVCNLGSLLATRVARHGWFDTDHQCRCQDTAEDGRRGTGRPSSRVSAAKRQASRSTIAARPFGALRCSALLGGYQASAWTRLFAPGRCFEAGASANQEGPQHPLQPLEETRLPPTCFRLLNLLTLHCCDFLVCLY